MKKILTYILKYWDGKEMWITQTLRRLRIVAKEEKDKAKGSGEEKGKWKGYWKKKETVEKVSRSCGRGSQINPIFKMDESKQLALSSEV